MTGVAQLEMTEQQEFDFEADPPVYPHAPRTSHEAADSMRPHTSRLAREVWEFIQDRGGATCQEVEFGLGMAHQTASARIWELRKKKLIEDSGKTRKTTSGRNAIVWVVR